MDASLDRMGRTGCEQPGLDQSWAKDLVVARACSS